VKVKIIILTTIFVILLKRGLNQSKGRAKGPTTKNAITNKKVPKYHLFVELLLNDFPQCLHSITLSSISSAQYGHL